MESKHHHNHLHDHSHAHKLESLNAIFVFCILLNAAYVVIEAGVGLAVGSLGLISDAGHNLSDVFSLLLSLFAFRMANKKASGRFTYGYKKVTVLVSLINAVILLVAVGAIVVESVYKFKNATDVSGVAISWTAGVGILINGLTAILLMKNQKNDLNVKGAFMHMAMDTLVSVGVVVSGIVIVLTGWMYIDAIMGIVVACVILISTLKLLRESLFLSLDAVPSGIDIKMIEGRLLDVDGVISVHHIHIWAISTTENAATLHVVVTGDANQIDVKTTVKNIMKSCGVGHVTVEMEFVDEKCSDFGMNSCI